MPDQPTFDNMLTAAKNVLAALNSVGEPRSCLLGGMAARLHGIQRDVKVRMSSNLCKVNI
jgi:hypothetical protein